MSEHKNDGEFEDLFADDDFAETEQSASAEKNAEDALNGNGASGAKSSNSQLGFLDKLNLSKKDLTIYGVGGVVFLGVVYVVYRHFNPAVTVIRSHRGETRFISSHKPIVFHRKEIAKPKPIKKAVVKKEANGFMIDKKNLQGMISKFTDTASDIKKSQISLAGRISAVQNTVYKSTQESQKESQKEFLQVNQQLNLLAKQQSVLAMKQQKQQLAEASDIVSSVSKNSSISYAKANNKALLGLTKQMTEIGKSLYALKQSVVQTQVELKLVIAEKAANMQKITLRAVVPGRAWLVNGKGQTITISEGTEMPYYGKVLKIDSKSNTVTMSTGYIFS